MRPIALVLTCGALVGASGFAACSGFDAASSGSDGGAEEASTLDASTTDASTIDAPSDASTLRCRDDEPFGTPTELDAVNSPGAKSGHPTLRVDEKEIYFQRLDARIYVARRGDRTLPFDSPKVVDTGDAGLSLSDPSISTDGLTLYVGFGNVLSRMVRPSLTAPFGPPIPIGLDNPADLEGDPFILRSNDALYFTRSEDSGTGQAIWRVPRSANDTFSGAQRVDLGNAPAQHPVPSADELTLYFANTSDSAIWRARRTSPLGPFDPPKRVVELSITANDGGIDRPGWLSPDGCRLYMSASPGGDQRLFVAERTPR
jgi:hypothetical protein